MIVIQVVYWVIFMYGILSLIQDIITEFTYKKYNKNFKVFICIENFENEIEAFEREIERIKWQFKNISINVVNMDENYTDEEVKSFFEDTSIRFFSKQEYLNITQNI